MDLRLRTEVRSKLKQCHDLPVAWLRNQRPGIDAPESRRGHALRVARLSLQRVGGRRIVHVEPVEGVEELGSQLERHALPNAEDPSERKLLVGPALKAVVVVGLWCKPAGMGED